MNKSELIVLADANARLGQEQDDHIGPNSDDQEDSNGQLLRQFCQVTNLFPPSTWPRIHLGDNHTWIHPSRQTKSRLDYILIPLPWQTSELATWIEPSLHAGHCLHDHVAAVLRTRWTGQTVVSTKKKIPFDNREIGRQVNAEKLAKIWREAPSFPWSMNANQHACLLTSYLHKSLAECFPNERKRQQPQYVSSSTQSCYDKMTANKRHLRQVHHQQVLLRLRIFFEAWRDGRAQCDPGSMWQKKLAHKKGQLERDILCETIRLKAHLKEDKVSFVQKIAEDVKGKPVSEIYKMLRPILPKSKGPGGVRPLPRLQKRDGSYTSSRDEFDERWIQHFAEMESGVLHSPADFVKDYLNKHPDRILPTRWDIKDLPQLTWLEQAIQRLQRGKTPGPDALVNEVYKSSPEAAAVALLPLMWKLCLRMEEPITTKGGQIIPVYKHRGEMDSCSSYRGIMLMNSLGKIMRSANRSLMSEPWRRNSHGMQMGGKPGCPVLFGVQTIRHCINAHQDQGKSLGIIFADVESAYYRVVPQLVAGGIHRDEDLAVILKTRTFSSSPRPCMRSTQHYMDNQVLKVLAHLLIRLPSCKRLSMRLGSRSPARRW